MYLALASQTSFLFTNQTSQASRYNHPNAQGMARPFQALQRSILA
ncbi:MAG: hypothetical protein P8179_02550 [Candidatus Thiodiazotropha sp.]